MDAQFKTLTTCRLCDDSALKIERQIGEFPITRCESCDFLQTGKVLDEAEINRRYEDDYGGERMQQGQIVNAPVNLHLLEKSVTLSAETKLLDVGCGYGFFLKAVKDKYNADVTGVELAKAEVDFARDTLGINVLNSLEGLQKQAFDVICMFEVIEHIAKPREFLEEVIALLKPGGKLLIVTDNFSAPIVRNMGNHFPKWIPHQHISLFEGPTLTKLMQSLSGFSITSRYAFTPWELVAKGWVYKLTGGKKGASHFNLNHELSTEASRPYPLFKLRKTVNKYWVRFALRKNLRGEIMCITAQSRNGSE